MHYLTRILVLAVHYIVYSCARAKAVLAFNTVTGPAATRFSNCTHHIAEAQKFEDTYTCSMLCDSNCPHLAYSHYSVSGIRVVNGILGHVLHETFLHVTSCTPGGIYQHETQAPE